MRETFVEIVGVPWTYDKVCPIPFGVPDLFWKMHIVLGQTSVWHRVLVVDDAPSGWADARLGRLLHEHVHEAHVSDSRAAIHPQHIYVPAVPPQIRGGYRGHARAQGVVGDVDLVAIFDRELV